MCLSPSASVRYWRQDRGQRISGYAAASPLVAQSSSALALTPLRRQPVEARLSALRTVGVDLAQHVERLFAADAEEHPDVADAILNAHRGLAVGPEEDLGGEVAAVCHGLPERRTLTRRNVRLKGAHGGPAVPEIRDLVA